MFFVVFLSNQIKCYSIGKMQTQFHLDEMSISEKLTVINEIWACKTRVTVKIQMKIKILDEAKQDLEEAIFMLY